MHSLPSANEVWGKVVCVSVHGGGGVPGLGGTCSWGCVPGLGGDCSGGCLLPGWCGSGQCLVWRVPAWGVVWWRPPRWLLLRVVGIPLECILVFKNKYECQTVLTSNKYPNCLNHIFLCHFVRSVHS